MGEEREEKKSKGGITALFFETKNRMDCAAISVVHFDLSNLKVARRRGVA